VGRIAQFAFAIGTGILTPAREPPVELPPRSAPRRIAFHPGGRFAYVLDEAAGAITGFAFEATSGTLSPLAFQTVALAPGARGRGRGGDIALAPSGRALYASGRGPDAVVAFTVDATTGTLSPLARTGAGARPARALAVDPDGGWLFAATQGTPQIETFALDAGGAPSPGAAIALRSAPVALLVTRVTAR
jgi:6-phosphogluconolactonase